MKCFCMILSFLLQVTKVNDDAGAKWLKNASWGRFNIPFPKTSEAIVNLVSNVQVKGQCFNNSNTPLYRKPSKIDLVECS